MALYSDPEFDERMNKYFDHKDPQLLYQGSNEDIIEILKAWVVRRKAVFKEQFELRNQCHKSSRRLLNREARTQEPGYLLEVLDRNARVKVRKICSASTKRY